MPRALTPIVLALPLLAAGCVSVTTTATPRPAVVLPPAPQAMPAAASPMPGCAADPGLAAEQAALIAEINRERSHQGLAPVRAHPVLGQAAHAYACETARRGALSHTGDDGSRPGQRALGAGYDYRVVYENLGLGFHSAPQAMFYWMRSPGHRDNVLAPPAEDVALGLVRTGQGQRAWILMMGAAR